MLWYDPEKPDEGHSLGRVVVTVRPPEGVVGPFVVPRLFAYFQLHGDIGDYTAWISMVQVEITDDGDEVDRPVTQWGPQTAPVSGLEYVDGQGMILNVVPFDGPGVYEFRLWLAECDDVVAMERVEVPRVIQEMP